MGIFAFSCILLLTLSLPILWSIHSLLAILVVVLLCEERVFASKNYIED
jgi:hypothetical protein